MTVMENIKKLFKKNNSEKTQVIYKNSTSKYSMTADCTMKLSSQTELKKQEINSHLKQLIKKYIDNPEKLIQYMRLKGLDIYKINNADIILSKINEEEGFIPPLKGFKAIILTAVLSVIIEHKLKIKYSTEEMLVFDCKNTDIYTIARALHKYYGFKNNLPGFDKKSQDIFKKIYAHKKSKYGKALMENASLKDILSCKEALARDLDSINFTIQLSREHESSKKALNKIISEQKIKI